MNGSHMHSIPALKATKSVTYKSRQLMITCAQQSQCCRRVHKNCYPKQFFAGTCKMGTLSQRCPNNMKLSRKASSRMACTLA